MPKKGEFTEENKKQLDAARERSRSPTAKRKRAASLALTTALKNEVGFAGRLTPLAEEYLRKVLMDKDKQGRPFLHAFIDNFLAEAKKDPGSRPGQMIASALFSSDLLTKLDAELNAQMEKDREFLSFRIRNTLYDKQQAVYDNTLDNTIECICTRRAGKSELLARLALNDLTKKGHRVLYINRNFNNAVSQMGGPFTKLLETLGIEHDGSVGGGLVKFPQWDSSVMFGGYNNKGDIDRYRGEHFSLILVDEIGHLRNPKSLVTEVLEPAMIDYGKEAKLIYTGTPPRTRKSYAKELWDNPNIKHYKWSFMDNPFIPDKENVIENVCKKHNCTVDAPFIQREYFGNMEAYDMDAMFIKHYSKIPALPDMTFTKAWVGVDWGFEDKAAVISAVADSNKNLYIVRSWSEAKQPISVIAAEVKRQYDELKKLRIAVEPMVICDTNEKGAIADLYTQYQILAYGAYKYDKDMALEQLAEWFHSSAIKIIDKENEAIIEDAENMIWARDEDTDEITHELDDDEYHGNTMFALLYVSRQYAFDVLGLIDSNKSAKAIMEEA